MRTILIINGYLDIGGAERVLTLIANKLCYEYNVKFAILRCSNIGLFALDRKVDLIELNLETDRRSAKEMGILKSISYFISTTKIIQKLINETKADIVIAFNDREVILSWLSLRRNANIKLICSQRNSYTSKIWRTNLLLKYIYRHSSASVFQLNAVSKFYGNRGNYYVIPNPVRMEAPLSHDIVTEPYILAAGRLTVQKRFDILIYAFNLFSQKFPEYKLKIFGKGEEQSSLIKIINKCNLQDKVFILNPISEVIKRNRSASMFVLSSDFEGIPNVVLEAMANGIPCVVTDCLPGGGEFVTNKGQCGQLVKCGDIQGICDAMIRYVNDTSFSRSMALKALDYIRRFDENIIIDQWKKLIQEVAGDY